MDFTWVGTKPQKFRQRWACARDPILSFLFKDVLKGSYLTNASYPFYKTVLIEGFLSLFVQGVFKGIPILF